MDEQLINRIPLFASLPPDELPYLLRSLHKLRYPEGAFLFREGDRGDRFYIVLDGQLEIISSHGTAEERILGVCEPGGCVGEMSLLDPDGMRSASVRTVKPSMLLEMSRGDFDSLLQRRPTIAYELARVLSLRLRSNNSATIRDLQEKNRQLAQAYEELKAAQAQIIEKEKLEHELQLAREIQQSILPRSLPGFPGFDLGARMVPARAVGGDFFDFIPLDADTLGIAIGDVSDKGVPSAIFMAVTRSLLRAEASLGKSPRETLGEVNRHLLDMNDAGMFVTVLYGVLDRRSRRFDYVRAGHGLPILCEACGTVLTPSNRLGQALGVFDDPSFDEQAMVLFPESTLLIYTDGVTDAVNEQMEFFGIQRVHEILRTLRAEPAQAVCDILVKAIMEYQHRASQHDDITIVAVRAAKD